MLNRPPSAGKLKRLNRRQRKKLRVGEFQELVFEIRMTFSQPLDEAAYDAWWDAFIGLIESRQLAVGGLGGRLPLTETEGIVSTQSRGSPTEEDRQAVLLWLQHRPEVASTEAGEFVDGWYGWGDST